MRISLWLSLILGIFFVLLSSIFFLAAFAPFSGAVLIEAIILLFIGLIFLYFYERGAKIEAQRPIELHQTVKIDTSKDMGGESALKDIRCKHCGAPLSAKDITITNAGVIVKCPYCGAVYRLEEEPKW